MYSRLVPPEMIRGSRFLLARNDSALSGIHCDCGFCGTKWSGWWFGTFGFFSHILGMSSSQLTNIFFRGVETTNQWLFFWLFDQQNDDMGRCADAMLRRDLPVSPLNKYHSLYKVGFQKAVPQTRYNHTFKYGLRRSTLRSHHDWEIPELSMRDLPAKHVWLPEGRSCSMGYTHL